MFVEASRTDLDKDRRLPLLAFNGEALARLAPDEADFKDDAATPAPEQLPHPAPGSRQALTAQGRKFYLSVRAKFVIALLFSCCGRRFRSTCRNHGRGTWLPMSAIRWP
jgi:hypothetical protein